jgi:enoyl-CoA hydratase/carnithine racemase
MAAESATSPILVRESRVGRIVLRDPKRRNALDAAALAKLEELIGSVARDSTCDVLVIAGEGTAFCAGFDLAACAEEPRTASTLLARLSACVAALRALDIPVVARVQGAALAGGCALLTGCDFVVVARDAQLGYPVHRLGISPAVSAPSLLSRMGSGARALLMSNDLITGELALAHGLATDCVDCDQLDAAINALVARLLAKGPLALRETKRWIRAIEAIMPGDLGATPPRDETAMARARDASMELAQGEEFAVRVREFWAARAAREST